MFTELMSIVVLIVMLIWGLICLDSITDGLFRRMIQYAIKKMSNQKLMVYGPTTFAYKNLYSSPKPKCKDLPMFHPDVPLKIITLECYASDAKSVSMHIPKGHTVWPLWIHILPEDITSALKCSVAHYGIYVKVPKNTHTHKTEEGTSNALMSFLNIKDTKDNMYKPYPLTRKSMAVNSRYGATFEHNVTGGAHHIIRTRGDYWDRDTNPLKLNVVDVRFEWSEDGKPVMSTARFQGLPKALVQRILIEEEEEEEESAMHQKMGVIHHGIRLPEIRSIASKQASPTDNIWDHVELEPADDDIWDQ